MVQQCQMTVLRNEVRFFSIGIFYDVFESFKLPFQLWVHGDLGKHVDLEQSYTNRNKVFVTESAWQNPVLANI